jgi:hypothetical protein
VCGEETPAQAPEAHDYARCAWRAAERERDIDWNFSIASSNSLAPWTPEAANLPFRCGE